MAIYTKVTGLHGKTVYKKDHHKFIKTADIPGNVMLLLEDVDEVDDENMQLTAPLKKCVFCEAPTKLYRVVNSQSIAVCEEHYHNRTLGQLAQQVRLNEEAKHEKVQA